VTESPTRMRMREYATAFGELHIVSRALPEAKETHEGALHVYPVHGSKLATLLTLPSIIRKIVTTKGIELVSAQDPFEHGFSAMQAVQGTKAKLHIQIHTDFLSPWFVRGSFLNKFRIWLADRVLISADGIRSVSHRIKDSVEARYGRKVPTVSVIPISTSSVLPPAVPLPPHDFEFAFITVGRLEPEKHIEDILRALALTDHQYQPGLMVVGEGSERKRLEELTHTLGLSKRVMFLGWRTDSLGLMQSAQAYIQASAYEGYGRTLIEAALSGLPIITTDVGVVGELLRGYEEVLVAPVADPAALAVHMVGLVADSASRIELALNARTVVTKYLETQNITAEEIARDLARLL